MRRKITAGHLILFQTKKPSDELGNYYRTPIRNPLDMQYNPDLFGKVYFPDTKRVMPSLLHDHKDILFPLEVANY